MPASSRACRTNLVTRAASWTCGGEARLFKYGSGTGSNFSLLRGEGEKLSGGGRSSGLMSFLKIATARRAPSSRAGTTRRRQMVIVRRRPPDIGIHRLEGARRAVADLEKSSGRTSGRRPTAFRLRRAAARKLEPVPEPYLNRRAFTHHRS